MRRSIDVSRCGAIASCCALAFAVGCNSKTGGGADFVFTGGHVFTGDSANAWVQAIAIAGDRIIAVGTDSAITTLAGARTQRITLAGRLVIPGFNDAHAHVGAGIGGVTFHAVAGPTPDPAIATVLVALKSAAKKAGRNAWLVTDVGDRVLSDPKARRTLIDGTVPNRPVMLRGWTGHGAVLNSTALHVTGLDTASDVEGGWQERDAAGKPTGRVDEYALFDIERAIEVARGQNPTTAAFRAYDLLSASLGITSTQILATNFSPSLFSHIERTGVFRSRQRIIPFEMTGVGRRESLWVGAKPSNMLTTISGAKWIL
ncbi:MAG: amidohydrolase family protein, partial [Gemmatimonadaceae bacterium]